MTCPRAAQAASYSGPGKSRALFDAPTATCRPGLSCPKLCSYHRVGAISHAPSLPQARQQILVCREISRQRLSHEIHQPPRDSDARRFSNLAAAPVCPASRPSRRGSSIPVASSLLSAAMSVALSSCAAVNVLDVERTAPINGPLESSTNLKCTRSHGSGP